jgi:hypothetical protein
MALYCRGGQNSNYNDNIQSTKEYALEKGRLEGLPFGEIKKLALNYFDKSESLTRGALKSWLKRRETTWTTVVSPGIGSGGLGDNEKRLVKQYAVVEALYLHLQEMNSEKMGIASNNAVSSGWLKQALENQEEFSTREGQMPSFTKVPSVSFMGKSQNDGGRRKRVEDGKGRRSMRAMNDPKNPACVWCGEETAYVPDSKGGKMAYTKFVVESESNIKVQVCRTCFSRANSAAEKPMPSAQINHRDRLTVRLPLKMAKALQNLRSTPLNNTSNEGKRVNGEDKPGDNSLQKDDNSNDNKGQGTEADPILLSSSSDEEDEDGKKNNKWERRLMAVVNPCQRKTRRSSQFETDPVLDELYCSMPPEGGHGAVKFMLKDFFRLKPEEFMNDSCIDYFIKYLELRLKNEKPDDWKRCYFFNSFFYKKLTDTSEIMISDETKSLVEGSLGDLDKISLQALRCYDVTKNWTKHVDIFSKDFLFVPIHDQLHWSLIIICHPGSGVIKMGTVAPADMGKEPEAFMIHLDSMKQPGGHQSQSIAKLISRYLQNEWKAKLLQPGDSVPKAWAAAHPDEKRDFLRMVTRRPNLPTQDNYYDCGSFVCAFVDHFLAHLPAVIHSQMVPTARTARDFFKRKAKPIFRKHPAFLTKKWFEPQNASFLRHHIAIMVLNAMAVRENLMDDHGRWHMDNLTQEAQHKMQFIMAKLDSLKEEGKYHSPSWDLDFETGDDSDGEDEIEGNTSMSSEISIDDSMGSETSKKKSKSMENVVVVLEEDKLENKVDDEFIDIEGPVESLHLDDIATPTEVKSALNVLKKKRKLRSTPDVDILSVSAKDSEEIDVSGSKSPLKRSKNRFARGSKPSVISRKHTRRSMLASCFPNLPDQVANTVQECFRKAAGK